MKKVLSLLLIMVMVMTLVACGKKEEPSDSGKTDVSQTTDNKKDAEPTTEPTKAAEPTSEPTAEPTAEPEPDPDYGEDYSEGHAYEGIWQSSDRVLEIISEGAADVVRVYYGYTDRETYGEWEEFWTSFSPETNSFYAEEGILWYYEADDGQLYTDIIDGLNLQVVGDQLVWGDQSFRKISENPFIREASDDEPIYHGDYGDGFGATFTLEEVQPVDVIATTFFGVYCENRINSEESFYYSYDGDMMAIETADEFSAAYLDLGIESDQGQLCFVESGINSDVNWAVEDGKIKVHNNYSGDEYEGMFYWDNENQRQFVCLIINDEYHVWMASGHELYAQPEGYISDETARCAIEQYCRDTKLASVENPDQYNISWIVDDSTTDDEIVILYRSYTGAYVYYYVDRHTGETHAAEFVPDIMDVPQPTDENFNALDYWY